VLALKGPVLASCNVPLNDCLHLSAVGAVHSSLAQHDPWTYAFTSDHAE